MKDEVLKKLSITDSSVIPRYEIVDAQGNILYSRVQIRLLNTVLEPGTPLNKTNLLSDDTSTALGLDPTTSTPDEAFATLMRLLKGICPKLAISYTVGSTVFMRNMNTQETVQKIVPAEGFAVFDIFEYNGYEYWGVTNGVSTEHDWLLIDTAKLYDVKLT